MKYAALLKHLQSLSKKQLDMNVTIFDANDDQLLTVDGFAIAGEENEDDCRPNHDGDEDEGGGGMFAEVKKKQPYMIVGIE